MIRSLNLCCVSTLLSKKLMFFFFFADSGDSGEPGCTVSWPSVDSSSGWMDRVGWIINKSLCVVIEDFCLSPSIFPPYPYLSRMIWLLFICFTTFHLVANHRAVSVVAMETLNKNRLHLVMSHYLSTGAVLPVKRVNAREPILTSKDNNSCFKLFVAVVEKFLCKF